jgi:hypothetical protein
MQPERLAIRDRLFELGIELPEPLLKPMAPVSPPTHPPKVVWRREEKAQSEQNVVQQPHKKGFLLRSPRILRMLSELERKCSPPA